jgi:hypothetical protein
MLDIEARMAVTNDVLESGVGTASCEDELKIDSLRITCTDANDREVVYWKWCRWSHSQRLARSASLRGRTAA